MAVSQTTARPNLVKRAIWACFWLQALIGTAVVWAAIAPFVAQPPRSDVPALDPSMPVDPNDQRRLYDPARLPAEPVPLRLPDVDMASMPETLQFSFEGETASRVLRLTGAIEPGAAERFERRLAIEEVMPERVILHSPGGSVSDALTIGQRLRDEGLSTEVPAQAVCLSACPYIFAGGVEREAAATAFIGVHQSYYDANTYLPLFVGVSDIQRSEAEAMRYLERMGVDPLVRIPALETPPAEIYLLTEEELLRYQLSTSVYPVED